VVRLTVVTPFWRRYEIGERMMARVAALRDELAGEVELSAIAVISENRWITPAARNGWSVVWAENDVRVRKVKVGVAMAGAEIRPDAVLVLGSDDFVCAGYVRAGLAAVAEGVDVWGVTDFYALDGDELWRWPGYEGWRAGEPVGAGRFYGRRLLDRIAWNPWGARDDDLGPMLAAAQVGAVVRGVPMGRVALVDVKDAESRTPPAALLRLARVESETADRVLASVGLR